jgi:hypothetical protein
MEGDAYMRNQVGLVAGRALAIIGGLLVVGVALRLIGAILAPVLPDGLMRDLRAGWNLLYGIVAPAMPPMLAVLMLVGICWMVVAIRR